MTDCHIKLAAKHDAAACFIDAGKCFLKVDQTEAAKALHMVGGPGDSVSDFDSTSDSNPSDVLLRRYDTSQTLSGDT
jgi:hypothetical protein